MNQLVLDLNFAKLFRRVTYHHVIMTAKKQTHAESQK